MQQRDPKTPQKPKKRPESSENVQQDTQTPKKSKVIFSPSTPAVPTPDSSAQLTHNAVFTHTSAVEKQLGDTILVFGEDEEDIYAKKVNYKKPIPIEKQVNTYRGVTQYLLALLRHTRENSPLKLAQLKGLVQTLHDLITLLSSDKTNPKKITKIKKIALLVRDFIKANVSPKVSDGEFKKNVEALYIRLRFNQPQQTFLTQLFAHLNTFVEDNDDSLQAHINRTTENIARVQELISFLEKNQSDFQEYFLKLLQQRLRRFDKRLQIVNQWHFHLQKEVAHHNAIFSDIDAKLFKEESALKELKEKSIRTEKELARFKKIQSKESHLLDLARERLVKKLGDLDDRDIPASETKIRIIQSDLEELQRNIDGAITLQNSIQDCTEVSPETKKALQNIQLSLAENTRQLNVVINTLFSNDEDILTPNEMQPSPHTPKCVSPVAAEALTPNTEIKAFIRTLEEFTANILDALEEERAHAPINSPVRAPEVPTFDGAFSELQQQKAILENYIRKLDESTDEYAAVQRQIKLIAQHIESGIALLQHNHRMMTTLEQQKRKAEKSPREKSPFKIITSLKRGSQTPPSEKKSEPATTPLWAKDLGDVEVDMEFASRLSPPRLKSQKRIALGEDSPFFIQLITLNESVFAIAPENPAEQSPPYPSTQIVKDEDEEADFLPHKNYVVHEVLGNGECGLTAFGITRKYAHELLCKNIQRVKYLLNAAVVEALLSENFQNYLADNNVDFDNDNQITLAYINYDVRNRQIDNGWSHPAVLQALAEIQGIGLRIWRRNERGNLVPHRTNEYDYAEHIPAGATQITDLLFVNGNHFNLLEFEENLPQPQPTYLPNRFFAASEPPQKRTRVFYLSADEAINQFGEISTRLKDGLRELLRIFTTEQRIELENVKTLFNDATASLEKLIEQVKDEGFIKVLQRYKGKIELFTKEANAYSPQEYLEKAYAHFVGPLEDKQDNRKVASPPRL
ncbi:MAG: hypothetical protein SFW07_02920 [Gammaproteobacteria bacterium]|nr:hypothetical protein [Gammaproteobacteria bacterium]